MVSNEYEIDPCDPPVTHRARIEVKVEYDHEKGELNFTEGTHHQITKVRDRFEEEVFRRAVVIELERLGYTVIAPGIVPPCLAGCAPNWTRHHPECLNNK